MPKRPGPFWQCLSAFWDKLFQLREAPAPAGPWLRWWRRRLAPRPLRFLPGVEPLEPRLLLNVTLLNLQPFQATEQATATAVVATADFTTGSAADYSISVFWGDGTSSSGVAVTVSPTAFNIQVSHAYADEGTFPLTLTVSGDGSTATATTAATAADAPLGILAGGPLNAGEGQTVSAVLATFWDSVADPTATYTALIDWGDHTFSAGTLSGGSVGGQHTYDEGSYTIAVTVYDDGGASTSTTLSATISDAPLTATGQALAATEGQSSSGTVATFSDTANDPSASYTASINWGDGNTTSGTASGGNVQGQHPYAEEGSYTVTVTVYDDGRSSVTATALATVADAPLSVTAAGSTQPVEGQSFFGTVATFSDAGHGSATYTASIDWGDGSQPSGGSVSGPSILGQHSYAEEGSYTITVRVFDDGGSSAAATGTVTVSDAPLTVTAGSPVSAVEGQSFSGTVATVSDPGHDSPTYTASINWGDGRTTSGTVSGGSVQGQHSYADEGNYTVTITVYDDGGAGGTGRSTASVSDAALTVTAGGRVSAAEGQGFSGTVATFSDAANDPSATYTASINWGDGSPTTSATVSGSSILGRHTYAEEGNYSLFITATDDGGAGASATLSATITDAPLTATGQAFATTEGQSFSGTVATFSDPAQDAATYTALINWGDGSTTSGTISGTGILGQHRYAEEGSYTVTVTVSDDGSSNVTATALATVADAPLTVTAGSPVSAVEGQSYSGTVATFSDSASDPTATYTASINWGDGSTTSGTVSGSSILGNHPFDEGTYTITVTVYDDGGASASATLPATISDAPLTATGRSIVAIEGQAYSGTVATFSDAANDPSASYTASINWGDGSTTSGTVSGSSILGNHPYAEEGSYTVTVTVYDDGRSTATALSTATVADAPLTVTAGSPVSAVEGQSFSGTVATFSDSVSDPTATYTASINWGDGSTTSGTVSGSSILGSHSYQEEGSYTVTVRAYDDGGGSGTASLASTVADAPLTATGQSFRATQDQDVSTTVASFSDAGTDHASYTASIDWGDGSTTSGTVSGTSVVGDHSYAGEGDYTVTVTVYDDGGASATATGLAEVAPDTVTPIFDFGKLGSASPLQRSDDPQRALLVPVGEAQVDVNLGGLRLSQALDFDQSPGSDVGRGPSLTYNSSTVAVRPIIKVLLQTDAAQPLPQALQLRLTFGGTQQGWVSFNTAGYQPGASYVLAVQVTGPVAATGRYRWQIDLQADYGGGLTPEGSLQGETAVVVRDQSPYGAGWGIDSLDQLVPVAGGVLWVTGAGDSRFFAGNGPGSFTSPAEDTGSLVQNGDGSYSYTALGQTRWQFGADGLLGAVTDTHGLSTVYSYDSQGRLLQVNSIDGGISTLSYANGFLAAITEPGGRTLSFSQNVLPGGVAELTGLVDAAGKPRTFGYDGQHRLTSDSWQPYQGAFSYDAATGLLTTVGLGLGVSYGVTAANSAGLQTSGLLAAGQEDVATLSDALNETTTYDLDVRGRPLAEQDAAGATQAWQRNGRGQVTASTDARQATTYYHYDAAGDLAEQDNPDNSSTAYSYDPTFHQVTKEVTTVATGETEETDNSYDPSTGDLLSTTTAAGTALAATTTYVWANGLMMSSTDGDGNETDYSYDSYRRLTGKVEHQGSASGPVVSQETYSYDAAGNPAGTTNSEGITADVYDANNQLVSEAVYAPDGLTLVSASSTAYLAAGVVSKTADGDGNYTVTTYDTAGRKVSEATYSSSGVLTSQVSYPYDAASNLTRQTAGDGSYTVFTYDRDGRVLSQADYNADGTLVSTSGDGYDGDGEVTKTTDGDGNSTVTTYDTMGRELTVTVYNGQNVVVSSVSRTYDLAGDLVEEAQGNGSYTLYSYDVDSRLLHEEAHNADGTLVSQMDYTYDKDGYLASQTGGDGNKTVYTRNADGQVTLEQVFDKNNNLVSQQGYGYDTSGAETSTTDGDGNTTSEVRNAAGQVTQRTVTDKSGNVVSTESFAYDKAGFVVSQTDGDGNVTRYTRNANGQVTLQQVFNAAGTLVSQVSYGYNLADEQTGQTDGVGNVTSEVLNADGQVTQRTVTDKNGNVISTESFVYDKAGYLVSQTDGDNNTTVYTRNANGEVTLQQVFNAAGTLVSQESFAYDLADQQTSQTDGDGNTISEVLNAAGQVTQRTVTDKNGNVVSTESFVYDKAGFLVSQTDGDGNVTQYTRNANGEVTLEQVFNAAGTLVSQVSYGYDLADQQTGETDGVGNSTSETFNAAGRVTQRTVTDKNGNVISTESFGYDKDGLLVSQTDGDNNTTVYTRNADGQVTLQQVYDKNHNLVSQESFAYDLAGQETSVTDGDGNTTTEVLNADGRVTQRTVTDKNGNVVSTVSFVYDKAGLLVSQTDGDGNVTQFTRNANGEVTLQQVFNSAGVLVSQVSYSYNLADEETGETDGVGNTTTALFNAAGQVTQRTVTDKNGNVVSQESFAYDKAGFLLSQTDGDGNVTKSTRNANGEVTLEQVFNAAGTLVTQVSYTYDLADEQTGQTDGVGNTTTETSNAAGQVTQRTVTDKNGNVVSTESFVYDKAGFLVSQTDGDGNVTQYTRNANGEVTLQQVFNAAGTLVSQVSYSYDLADEQTGETDGVGNTTSETFNAASQVTQRTVTDKNGNVVSQESFTYDKAGFLLSQTDGDGNVTKYTRNADGQVTLQQVYNSSGTMVSQVSLAYDLADEQTSQTDGDGNTTSYTRNADGAVTQETLTNAQGTVVSTESFSFDKAGEQTSQTDADGNTTSYTRNAAGQVTAEQVRNAAGVLVFQQSWAYDQAGNETSMTDGDGNVTTYVRNADGQVTHQELRDPSGKLISQADSAYDKDGYLVSQADGDGNVTTFVNDASGRVLHQETRNASGTVVSQQDNTYDQDGNLLTTTDGDGLVMAYTYDGAGRKLTETRAYGTPQAATTTFKYDQDGNLVQITDPDNNHTYFTCDADGNVLSQTDALGHTTSRTYDADGRLTSQTDRDGRRIAYGYDAAGNLVSQQWYDASGNLVQTLSWTYDQAGRLLSASNNSGTYTFQYDAAGHVTQVTEPFGVTLNMGYDLAGNRTSVTDSLGGSETSTYDGNLLVSRVLTQSGLTLREDFRYDLAGNVTSETRYSNAAGTAVVATTTLLYDAANRLTSEVDNSAGGAQLASFTFSYDTAGRLTSQNDNGVASSYSYDKQGQLTSDSNKTYGCDAAGNPTGPGFVIGPANQLLSDGVWNYSYDNEGNLVQKTNIQTGEVWAYTYDNKNQMTWATHQASGQHIDLQVTFAYDVFGNLVQQQTTTYPNGGGQTTTQRYAWDGWKTGGLSNPVGNENWDVWADLDGNNNLVTRYLHTNGVDDLVGRITPGSGAFWTLTDYQGSIRLVLDGSGNVLDSVRYDGFGNIVAQTAPQYLGNYAYTGRLFVAEVGLQYNRERWYNPETGRWETLDPEGIASGDFNWYRYTGNAPTNATDPSGLQGDEPVPLFKFAPKPLSARAAKVQALEALTEGLKADLSGETERKALGQILQPSVLSGVQGATWFSDPEKYQKGLEAQALQRAKELHAESEALSFRVQAVVGGLFMPFTTAQELRMGATPEETARLMLQYQREGRAHPLLNPLKMGDSEARRAYMTENLRWGMLDVTLLGFVFVLPGAGGAGAKAGGEVAGVLESRTISLGVTQAQAKSGARIAFYRTLETVVEKTGQVTVRLPAESAVAIRAGAGGALESVAERVSVSALAKQIGKQELAAATRAAAIRDSALRGDPKGAINLIDPFREPQDNFFFRNILRRKDIDPNGFLDVVGHGNDEIFMVFNSPEGPEYLAQVIMSDPKFNGKVRILSCLTGHGENSFAQRLANILDREMKALGKDVSIEVKASNGFLHAADDGSYYLNAAKKVEGKWVPDPKGKADWIIFKPKSE